METDEEENDQNEVTFFRKGMQIKRRECHSHD
jgi:hypothetical protein